MGVLQVSAKLKAESFGAAGAEKRGTVGHSCLEDLLPGRKNKMKRRGGEMSIPLLLYSCLKNANRHLQGISWVSNALVLPGNQTALPVDLINNKQ